MKKLASLIIGLLFAGTVYSGELNLSAAGEGMAGANMTGSGGVMATGGNAAGLGFEKAVTINMTYRRGLLEANNAEISAIVPLGDAAMEVIGRYTDYGEINNPGAEDSALSVNDFEIGAGYGIKIGEALAAGGAVRVKKSAIGGYGEYRFDFDLSAMYQDTENKFVIMGKGLAGNSSILAGASRMFVIDGENDVRAEFNAGVGGEEEMYVALGGEYRWKKAAAIRAGYRIEKESVNSIYAGAGIEFMVSGTKAKIDYAISPKIFFENDADFTHAVSFGIVF